jgi:flagellar M-ring protein FliF
MATTPDAPLQNPTAAPGAGGASAFRQRIEAGLARLSNQQKLALIVALAAVVVLIVGSLLYGQRPDYKVLFSNLSEKDGGTIITALEQMNVPYKFSESGGAILVPAEKVHEARLRLATQGLPRGGTVGFELLENQKFGITQFAEQVNYQRALEGELARTIQTVAAVQMARVHLAIPKPSVFVREEAKPSASVMLHLHPGRQLEPQQVAGITHLVASSIPNMPTGNISIVDQNGTLISQLKSALTEAGLDPAQLKYVRDVEASVIKRIEDILLPITGTGKMRVQVAADIDFAQTEQTAETFRPNTDPQNAAIRSQQSNENIAGTANPSGVPGALSNQPPVPATAPLTSPAVPGAGAPAAQGGTTPGRAINAGVNAAVSSIGQPLNSQKAATINYEVDKTITHTKNPLGRVKRLSVAVLVDNKSDKDKQGRSVSRALTDAEVKQLSDLAKEAMGYSQPRGDSLLVVNSSFSPLADEPSLPIWKQAGFWDLVKELVKYLLIAGVVAYIFVAVIRPLLKQMFPPPEPAGAGAAGGTISVTDEAVAGEDEEELNLAYATYEKKLERAKKIAIEDPKSVANIMKDWITPNG